MVKRFLLFLLSVLVLAGIELSAIETKAAMLPIDPAEVTEPLSRQAELDEKISGYIGEDSFERNRDYIHIIFKDHNTFYNAQQINAVAVVETLEKNGLLKLFFDKPQQYEMTFHTTGEPLFFVKLMSDTLRDIGYYRYVTKESSLSIEGFEWKIALEAEYVTDPVLLREKLELRGCEISDIIRVSANDWHYSVEMSKAHLQEDALLLDERLKYRRLQEPKWVDVASVNRVEIKSHRANYWYPYIAFYDSDLRLLKVLKQDEETKQLVVELPESTRYIRVTDLYTITNIRYGLEFIASSAQQER